MSLKQHPTRVKKELYLKKNDLLKNKKLTKYDKVMCLIFMKCFI